MFSTYDEFKDALIGEVKATILPKTLGDRLCMAREFIETARKAGNESVLSAPLKGHWESFSLIEPELKDLFLAQGMEDGSLVRYESEWMPCLAILRGQLCGK